MKNAKTLFQELVRRIGLKNDPDEVKTMASMLLEKVFGVTMADIMAGRMVDLTADALLELDRFVERLNRHEPVQYVLGEAVFCGRVFKVSPSVLIPRPETEELVRAVLEWKGTRQRPGGNDLPQVLDVGTGSGCIAITLSLEWPEAHVVASDVSVEAIAVARENAREHGAKIRLVEHDILRNDIPVQNLEVIVSNPPYIAENEKGSMFPNVLEFEPHVALFVPDSDPLLFYRSIVAKAETVMNVGGLLALEINEKYGEEVCDLLIGRGWKGVELIKDVSSKPRVVRAICE